LPIDHQQARPGTGIAQNFASLLHVLPQNGTRKTVV
jgi:hypothetical protein